MSQKENSRAKPTIFMWGAFIAINLLFLLYYVTSDDNFIPVIFSVGAVAFILMGSYSLGSGYAADYYGRTVSPSANSKLTNVAQIALGLYILYRAVLPYYFPAYF